MWSIFLSLINKGNFQLLGCRTIWMMSILTKVLPISILLWFKKNQKFKGKKKWWAVRKFFFCSLKVNTDRISDWELKKKKLREKLKSAFICPTLNCLNYSIQKMYLFQSTIKFENNNIIWKLCRYQIKN